MPRAFRSSPTAISARAKPARRSPKASFPAARSRSNAQPEGTNDPLFRPIESGAVHPDAALTTASALGRVGGNFNNLAEAYRSQLTLLDRVLAGCGHAPASASRTSLFDIPDARSRISTAATIAENLLLEYAQGMSQADTGWGCLDGATLRAIMQVNSANWDYGMRTPAKRASTPRSSSTASRRPSSKAPPARQFPARSASPATGW